VPRTLATIFLSGFGFFYMGFSCRAWAGENKVASTFILGGGMALTLKVLYSLFFSQDMAFAVNLFELCPKTYQASRELHLALKITVSYPFKQQKFG